MAITYKCPNCGAILEYKEGTDELSCANCGTTVSVDSLEDTHQDFTAETGTTEDYKRYTCSSCGAELLTDENTSALICGYCGSPALIEDRMSGVVSPKYVIPFNYNKDQAVEAFRKWTRSGRLTPSVFRKQATIEKLTGIYVPFWLYDMSARCVANAECTKVRMYSDSKYQYTETSYYNVRRDISAEFLKIPADASEKMDDGIMDKLEPFTYSELTEFQKPYLSGFVSEKYNFDSDDLYDRVRNRVDGYMEDELSASMAGYTTQRIISDHKSIARNDAKYVLLPVWMLNYRYKGQDYQFAMNGQTGKIVGDLPVSMGKATAALFGLTAGFFAIISLIGGFVL